MSDEAATVIGRVLTTGVLSPDLITIPERGATTAEIDDEEKAVARRFSRQLRSLLGRWNGLDLDVIRIYGCGAVAPGIKRLSAQQLDWPELEGHLLVGSDPSGFLYLEDQSGGIVSFDTKGDEGGAIAADWDDLFLRLVFGEDAASFAGDDWAAELRKAGIVA